MAWGIRSSPEIHPKALPQVVSESPEEACLSPESVSLNAHLLHQLGRWPCHLVCQDPRGLKEDLCRPNNSNRACTPHSHSLWGRPPASSTHPSSFRSPTVLVSPGPTLKQAGKVRRGPNRSLCPPLGSSLSPWVPQALLFLLQRLARPLSRRKPYL